MMMITMGHDLHACVPYGPAGHQKAFEVSAAAVSEMPGRQLALATLNGRLARLCCMLAERYTVGELVAETFFFFPFPLF